MSGVDPMSQESESRQGRTNAQTESHAKKRRRRKRMNPLLYLLLVLAVSAILAGVCWMLAGDLLALNKRAHTAVITLPESIFTMQVVPVETTAPDGTEQTFTKMVNVVDLDYVTDELEKNGLIEYKPLFRLFTAITGVKTKGKLTPGTYELNTDMDYHALLNAMSARSGNRLTVQVTIPEGYTVDQIFDLLDEKEVATREQLEKVAANHDFKFSFLRGILPLGDYHRLEGYLFPDTYEFYMGGDETATIQVLNKMILRFDEKLPDKLRKQAEDMGYSVHQLVTIASLIEKETTGEDQTHIASVIYNRLKHPEKETNGYLQIDAAIAYITGRTVTQADYQDVLSPYNTYLNKGLPPGPIANPGMVALNSALNPDETNDYFYVLGNDGLHHFFKTHREFEAYRATLSSAQGEDAD